MIGVSLDPRAAGTCHPDAVALDRRIHLAAVAVFLEEGIEVAEQAHQSARTQSHALPRRPRDSSGHIHLR